MGLVAEHFSVSVSELTSETRFLIADLNVSRHFTRLIMSCEEAFGIAIPDADARKLVTVGLLAAYLEALVQIGGTVWPPPRKIAGYES